MEIRRARPSDVGAITSLEKDIFTDPWSERDITSYITSDDGMCYTALADGEVVAYLVGRKIAPEGEIYRIAVREDKRERGIGYRLLSYALKTEMGAGVETFFLEVRSKNVAARKLYSSYGFVEIGTRKSYYKNPADDAVIMLKDSSKSI